MFDAFKQPERLVSLMVIDEICGQGILEGKGVRKTRLDNADRRVYKPITDLIFAVILRTGDCKDVSFVWIGNDGFIACEGNLLAGGLLKGYLVTSISLFVVVQSNNTFPLAVSFLQLVSQEILLVQSTPHSLSNLDISLFSYYFKL